MVHLKGCLVKTATNQNGESQNRDKKLLYCARLASTYFNFLHFEYGALNSPYQRNNDFSSRTHLLEKHTCGIRMLYDEHQERIPGNVHN